MTFVQIVATSIGLLLACGLLLITTRNTTRSQGKNVAAHVIFIAVVAGSFFIPMGGKEVIFSPISVIIVGSVLPVYESIRAVCTIEETDDTTWLTYWISQGIVSFSTEWVDGLGNKVSTTWDMFEFFFYLWLILPQTDGATMIFDLILEPLVAPIIQPMVQKTEGLINKIILAVTNAAHLGFVWIAFVFLPQGLKRTIWILLATLYPMGSSIVSVTTPDGADDTFWLTYWSCFGILFLLVDFIENYIGQVPGFYTVVIGVTIYLMLPLFRGADQVFRSILVPLAGLQELIVKKDAEVVKNQVLKDIPPERRALLLKEIAKSFADGAVDSDKKTSSKIPVSPTGYTQIV